MPSLTNLRPRLLQRTTLKISLLVLNNYVLALNKCDDHFFRVCPFAMRPFNIFYNSFVVPSVVNCQVSFSRSITQWPWPTLFFLLSMLDCLVFVLAYFLIFISNNVTFDALELYPHVYEIQHRVRWSTSWK